MEDSHQNKFCYMDGAAASASSFKMFVIKYLWYSKQNIWADEKSHSKVSKLSYF